MNLKWSKMMKINNKIFKNQIQNIPLVTKVMKIMMKLQNLILIIII